MTFKVKDGLALGSIIILDSSGNLNVPEKLTLSNTTTTRASINMGTGVADPSAPVNGDVWINSGVLKLQQSGATKTVAFTDSNITGTAVKATNLVGGNSSTLLGSVPYQSNTDSTTLVAPNTTTTKKFFRQTGTGSNGAAPAWDTIVDSDIPSALTGKTYNKLTITAPATGSTLTIADGKTLTSSNTLSLSGTDGAAISFGAGGTVAYTSNKLNTFSATTSAELAAIISDETGTGALVFANSPTFTTDIRTPLVYGSTAASGTLTLSSTTSATRGTVFVGGTGDTIRLPTTTNGFVKVSSSNGTISFDTNSYYFSSGTDVAVADGGTGTSTAPAVGGIIFGASGSAYGSTAQGSTGQILMSAGAGTPTWTSATFPSTLTTGDILYSSATNVLSKLPIGAAGTVLKSNGSIVSWSADINTYPDTWTWAAGTTSGPTASITGSSPTISVTAIPSASATASGVITTGAQTIAGTKTFSNTISGTISNATNAVDSDRVDGQNFLYANNSNAPTYLWGTDENGTSYLASRASMSVNYASTAGSAPASDVYSWAKTPEKPTYTKSEVGLSNVDNIADANKSVSYATTARRLARSDSAVDLYNVQTHFNGQYWELKGYYDSAFHAGCLVAYATTAGSAPASDVYSWAKASTRPTYTKSDVGLANVDNTADSTKNVANADTVDGQNFTYSNTSNSPLYVWGTDASGTNYLASRASMSVNYANSAGSAPASDVYAWAKAATKPSYTKSEVGLANVDNTADSSKSVNYAGSAGSATNATNATNSTYLLSNSTGGFGVYYLTGTGSASGGQQSHYIGPAWTAQTNTIDTNISGLAGSVTIGYNNDTNSSYQMLWGSGNGVYGTAGITCNPATDTLTVGALYSNGYVTAYSDESLKTNWREFGVDFLKKLALVKTGIYDRVDKQETQVGDSAQSIQQVLPDAVVQDENGLLSVAYGNAALAAAVMLARKVEELEARIAALEGK